MAFCEDIQWFSSVNVLSAFAVASRGAATQLHVGLFTFAKTGKRNLRARALYFLDVKMATALRRNLSLLGRRIVALRSISTQHGANSSNIRIILTGGGIAGTLLSVYIIDRYRKSSPKDAVFAKVSRFGVCWHLFGVWNVQMLNVCCVRCVSEWKGNNSVSQTSHFQSSDCIGCPYFRPRTHVKHVDWSMPIL